MKNIHLHFAILMFLCGNLNLFITKNNIMAFYCYTICVWQIYLYIKQRDKNEK